MASALVWILATLNFQAACAVSQATYSTVSSAGRVLRSSSKSDQNSSRVVGLPGTSAQGQATDKIPSVTVFIVTTPDEQHVTMLKNLLCSLFASSEGAASRQEITVLLHPGHGTGEMKAEELQGSLQSLGYARLSVLDGQSVFGNHPHWNSLKDGFPSNLRVFGIRYALSKMARDSHLLVIDEDVVCSPDHRTSSLSVPEEIAMRAPSGAAVVCAHEVPGVVDDFNNGFCLYRASEATDALLESVERKMVQDGFSGDQTPFNEVVRTDTDLPIVVDPSGSVPHAEPSMIVKPSSIVAAFGDGIVGYLRTWTHEGFPGANTKELRIVDSTKPETLIQWGPATPALQGPSSKRSSLGPLCLHYLPFSPGTHMWSHLSRQC